MVTTTFDSIMHVMGHDELLQHDHASIMQNVVDDLAGRYLYLVSVLS